MQLENVDPNAAQTTSEVLKILREFNELLPALIENLPGGAVFVVDRDLRYLVAEGEALSAAGFKPEDFVGQTIFEVLPFELAARYEGFYRQALAGKPFETEHNSHNRWYITRGTPLRTAPERSPNGDIYAVLAVSFDITERKRIEDERQQAEAAIAADLRDTQLLQDLSARLVAETDVQVFYDEILAAAIALTQADAGSLQVLDAATQELTLIAIQGFTPRMAEHFRRVNANSNTPCGIALTLGERTFTDFDVPEHEDPDGSLRLHLQAGFLSAQSIPLITRSGQTIGMFSTHWRKHHRPSDRELRFLDLLARQAADLIERWQAEQALRASEEKYRTLFNSMEEGFCSIEVLYDEDGQPINHRILEANPAFERHTGLSNPEGKLTSEFMPGVEPAWNDLYAGIIATGKAERLEQHSPTFDRWFDVEISRVGDASLRRVAVVFRDITDRKQAEATIRKSEERQTFLLKLSDALRPLADPVDIEETVTRTAMNYFGADRCYYCEIENGNAIIQRDACCEDLPSVVGVYPLSSFAILQAVIDAGCPFVVQDVHTTDMVDEDLRQLCIQLQVISYVDVPVIKNGKPVGILCLVQSTPRDWTDFEVELALETAERTWAAVERARAEQRLRASELQRLQEQSAREQERQRAEALAELDRAKTLFFNNISHEFRTPLTLSLAPLQDVLSDRTHPLDPVHRERLDLVHRNSLRLLKLVNTLLDFSRIEAGRMEAVYEPIDLAEFTTELASVFRSAIEQAGLRFTVDCLSLPEPIFVDREMWEKIVLNLLSNAFKFTWEGEITVSLRTKSRAALQASASNIHSLTLEPQSPSSDRETLSLELHHSTSEAKISSSDLDTSSTELGTTPTEKLASTSEVNLSDSELRVSPSPLTRLPGEALHEQTSKFVILEICDTGTGIAPEHLPHLFERFYQVRGMQARTHEGSGIGLALVYELVRLHGGTIAVSSTLGVGACFTVTLPFGTEHLPSDRLVSPQENYSYLENNRDQPRRLLASTAMGAATYVEEAARWLPAVDSRLPISDSGLGSIGTQSADRNRDEQPNSSRSRIQNPKSKVLLVDDNADMREYLAHILSEYVQVEAVADGATALAVAQDRVPDLILSDVTMPGLDGFELLQALRSDPRTRKVPFILLSARAGEAAIAKGLAAGANDYLVKPFSAQELVSRVNAHLQIAQLHGAALQAAQSTIRSRDEFISVISHELNTPLVSILGWTRLLRANPPSPTMLAKALDTIERNATLQGKLVQDLLDISRITADKLRLHLQPIELKPVIESAIATVAQTAADKGINLQLTILGFGSPFQQTEQPLNNPTSKIQNPKFQVMGDSDRLRQVICNLLTNAIKFTPESGSVSLELSVRNDDHSADTSNAAIRVIDTGIGISADFLPYVFDRFRQAEDSNAVKGLGLGLAIARHIVELHHGTIQAESAGEGQGTTFTVRLPLLPADDVD